MGKEKNPYFWKRLFDKDGTGVRDYIHVSDLASAFRNNKLHKEKKKNLIINLGSGSGHSVLDIINKVQEVPGISIDYEFKGRRRVM